MKPSQSFANRLLALGIVASGFALILVAFALRQNGSSQALPQNSSKSETFAPSQVNFAPPRLTSATDLDGKPVSLEQYRGDVILVNLWATWCPPCRAEMPALESFYQKHKKDGFVVLAIDQMESREEVAAFVSEYGLSFPVWLDLDGEAEIKFNTDALPSSYVIDRAGRARLAWTGGATEEQLETFLKKFLDE